MNLTAATSNARSRRTLRRTHAGVPPLTPARVITRSFGPLLAALLLALTPLTSAVAADAVMGDAEAGKEKSVTCQACHGMDGVGTTPDNPHLAGQVPGHIAQQLASFKSSDEDSRNNAIMLGMVAGLSEQDMADLDAFYSSLPAPAGSVAEADAEAARNGERIFRGGFSEREIPACMSCHGPDGTGVQPLYPRVAGQSAKYLETQLTAFKDGERQHNMMSPIAFRLSSDQIRELALFMSGLN